jgi:beta-aspartyl-dipeptidase (metallo-type)
VFNAGGRVTSRDVGDPGALAQTVQELLGMGLPLGQILPPVTRNVARVQRLSGKGRLAGEQGRAMIRRTFEEASR